MTQYLVRRIDTQIIEYAVRTDNTDPAATGPFDSDHPAPTVTPQCEDGCELIEWAGDTLLSKSPTPTSVLQWDGAAPLWVDLATLDDLKARKSADISQACADAITAGFSCDALGTIFTYPAKTNDQANLTGSVVRSFYPGNDVDWRTPFWCADADGAWEFRLHTAGQIQHVGDCAVNARLTCMAKNEQLQAQVAAAETAEALNEINW